MLVASWRCWNTACCWWWRALLVQVRWCCWSAPSANYLAFAGQQQQQKHRGQQTTQKSTFQKSQDSHFLQKRSEFCCCNIFALTAVLRRCVLFCFWWNYCTNTQKLSVGNADGTFSPSFRHEPTFLLLELPAVPLLVSGGICSAVHLAMPSASTITVSTISEKGELSFRVKIWFAKTRIERHYVSKFYVYALNWFCGHLFYGWSVGTFQATLITTFAKVLPDHHLKSQTLSLAFCWSQSRQRRRKEAVANKGDTIGWKWGTSNGQSQSTCVLTEGSCKMMIK